MSSADQIKPSVHPDLARHQAWMKPKIYSFNDHIHTAFGYTTSNCTLIEGDGGTILVDALQSMESARPVAKAFDEISGKPIRAVIYTHFHADHVSGIKAFVSEEEVKEGRVEIIAQRELTENILRDVGIIAPILGRRAMYQFGMRLPIGEEGTVGNGLGPPQRPETRTFIEPTRGFDDFLADEICGIRFEIHLVPSETEDQCVVWLPDEKILLSADAIQGETFPNIYALRGTRFRNPMIWAQGVDRLREFGTEILIPHHGRPVKGADAVEEMLVAYRDAIQYLHDQTVRWMNKGLTPDEIRDLVVMPEHLSGHRWLGEYYGSFKHGIPAVYAGYLGWYHGDPVDLDPAPKKVRAGRYVALMGGYDKVMDAARAALAEGDDQWAAELAGWLVSADPGDTDARAMKANALRHFGYRQKNATWRNWSLTSAMELDGDLKVGASGMVLGAPEQVRNFPFAGVMRIMTVRLIAEQAMDFRGTLAFERTDSGESCALEIRRGVCQFHDVAPKDAGATLRLDGEFLIEWLFGRTSVEDALAGGKVEVAGDARMATDFLAKFEPFNQTTEIAIAGR